MKSSNTPDPLKPNVTIIYVIDGKEHITLNDELKKKIEFLDKGKFHPFLFRVLDYLDGKVGIIKIFPDNVFIAYNAAGETISMDELGETLGLWI